MGWRLYGQIADWLISYQCDTMWLIFAGGRKNYGEFVDVLWYDD